MERQRQIGLRDLSRGERGQRYGLRREFPPHFYGTPESTGDGMQMDMEEPLGAGRTSVDDEGVIWHGNLVEPLPTAP